MFFLLAVLLARRLLRARASSVLLAALVYPVFLVDVPRRRGPGRPLGRPPPRRPPRDAPRPRRGAQARVGRLGRPRGLRSLPRPVDEARLRLVAAGRRGLRARGGARSRGSVATRPSPVTDEPSSPAWPRSFCRRSSCSRRWTATDGPTPTCCARGRSRPTPSASSPRPAGSCRTSRTAPAWPRATWCCRRPSSTRCPSPSRRASSSSARGRRERRGEIAAWAAVAALTFGLASLSEYSQWPHHFAFPLLLLVLALALAIDGLSSRARGAIAVLVVVFWATLAARWPAAEFPAEASPAKDELLRLVRARGLDRESLQLHTSWGTYYIAQLFGDPDRMILYVRARRTIRCGSGRPGISLARSGGHSSS